MSKINWRKYYENIVVPSMVLSCGSVLLKFWFFGIVAPLSILPIFLFFLVVITLNERFTKKPPILIIDYQQDFSDRKLSNEELYEDTLRLAEMAKRAMPYFTTDSHNSTWTPHATEGITPTQK